MPSAVKKLIGLAAVVAMGLMSLLGSGGGGDTGESTAAAPGAPTMFITATPRGSAWSGATYRSGTKAIVSNGESVIYRLGAGAPEGLRLDSATGAITWPVPASAGPTRHSFDIVAVASPSGATVTQPVSIEVLTPSTLIDQAVTQAGGTFADKSGSYRVTVPADSLALSTSPGHVSVDHSLNAAGERVLRVQYTGFKVGTRISEVFPKSTALPSATTRAKATVQASDGIQVVYSEDAWLVEPQKKKDNGWDDEYANFYVPSALDLVPEISEAAAAEGGLYDERSDRKTSAQLRRHTTGSTTRPVVIFVHGYQATTNALNECPFGGELEKDATWGEAGALLSRFAAEYEVYEFQWRTCQPFEVAAASLGLAIGKLFEAGLTSKKVTILAHSFGGVLVSTLLQKRFARQFAPSIEPLEKIQAVYLFDSPVSGIYRAPNASSPRFPAAGLLPNGAVRDNWAIDDCKQITCMQMGMDKSGEASAVVRRYFQLALPDPQSAVPGQFAKSLIAGWSDFRPTAFPAFSINVVFTDFKKRLWSDETPEPGDTLIDNRATALDVRHFQYNTSIPLPPAATGADKKAIDGYKDLHYLQRYYSEPEPGKAFAYPWVTEHPLSGSDPSQKVYKVIGSLYPAVQPIPSYVHYHFTNRPWSHTHRAFIDRDVYLDLPSVVKFEPGGSHLLEYFITKVKADVPSIGSAVVRSAVVQLVGKVVTEAGAPLAGMAYLYEVLCSEGGVEKLVSSGRRITASDGQLATDVRFDTACASSAITVRLRVGDGVVYRQFGGSAPLTRIGALDAAVFNGGLNIRLIKISDVLAKPDTDLIFLVDLSGSYTDDLVNFQRLSGAILNEVRDNGARVRVGTASFVDFPSWTGFGEDYSYWLWSGLSYDLAASQRAIASMFTANGGDIKEAQLDALYRLTFLDWTAGSQKVVAMATDAGFHDRDVEPTYPAPGYALTLAALRSKGIKVYVLAPGGTSIDPGLNRLAADTGGRVLDAGSGSAAVVCSFRAIFNGVSASACALAIPVRQQSPPQVGRTNTNSQR